MPRTKLPGEPCPHCGEASRKDGHTPAGAQKYRCLACGKRFSRKGTDAPEFAPEDVAFETLDEIEPEDLPFEMGAKAPASSKPRQQKAGPKKVISETTRIVGDGLAAGVLLATSQADRRKNLTMEEARSIGHPVVRMVGRRIPAWIKPLLPKTKLNPDDAADIEEIAATLAKWGVRLLTIVVQDFIEAREKALAGRQQQQAVHNTPPPGRTVPDHPSASLNDLRAETREQAVELATPQPNGHNPAFDVLNNIDLGIEAG